MPLEQLGTSFIPNPLPVLHRPFCHGPRFCHGSRKMRGLDRPWEVRRVKRLDTRQHRSVGIRTNGLWWSYDPDQQSQAISQENWWHCHLAGEFLPFCDHAHFLLNHWPSFVVHGLFYWLLLLLLLLIFIIFLFDVWFSFVGSFSPTVVELLSSFPGILPPVYVVTPIHVNQFALELENHPRQPQLSFILEGLSTEFWVGYNYLRNLKSASRNKPFAYAHPDIVDAYLANEVSLGTVVGSSYLVFDLHHTSQIQDLLHYFDDFITVGPHNSPLCAQYLGIVKQVCHTLWGPLQWWWSWALN